MRSTHPPRPRLVAALLVAAALAGLGGSAQAQTPERQVRSLLEQSWDHYDLLELEEGVQALEQALALADAYDVGPELVADVLLMLGIFEDAQYGDPERTIARFEEGLALQRDAQLNPYYTNPNLDGLLETARQRIPEPQAPPEPVPILTHQPAVTVRAGQPLTLHAVTREGAGVRRVVLAYRPYGAEQYSRTALRLSSPTEFHATIPGSITEDAGLQLEYFLQALSAEELVLASSGSATAPHAVVILREDTSASEPAEHLVAVSVGVGTGGGLATAEPEIMGDEVDLNPGVAPTPLHIYVDAMFRFAETFEVGPFLRLQLVLLDDAVELEPLVGLKLKVFFDNEGPTRVYGSFGGGYGYVRHTVNLAPTVEFIDTTREGPGHGGLGFGVTHHFSEHVGLLFDAWAMGLFDEVSVQLDLNLGLLLSF
jgi:hypothetical protein